MSDLYGQMQADPGLFAYLNQYQQPQRRTPMQTEGNNYGYASSPPGYMADHRRAAALMKALRGGLFAGGAIASATEPSMLMKGLAVPFGAAAMSDLGQFSEDTLHQSGIGQVDRNLEAMRRYGYDNMRGPR